MSSSPDTYRLGVDVGGTFTDACAFSPHGKIYRAKVPSTPHDQSVGVKNSIDKVRTVIQAEEQFTGKFGALHHGSTVATNALLEGKGVPAALIVTQGHKDVLVARRSQIPGGLAAWINWEPPAPLIPLERTLQVSERTAVDGSEIRPVDRDALRKELLTVKGKVQAVTVSLLNSWIDGTHEREVAEVVKEVLGDEVEVSLSHEVLPELGEYERTVTAAANSVVKPEVKRYMKGLSEKLTEDTPTVRILKSDGGLTNLELAGALPVNILMSGPAGGVRGITSIIANATPHKNLITLDMGGTSTDVALIANAQPSLRRETMVGDLAVRSPSVDVRTIGAGGGSLAFYSKLTNTLRVGPESSGAVPGPAAYGRGGLQATVTDANLVLGYLPETLLGGDFKLDVAAARAAVCRLAEEMGKTMFETAEAIVDLANEAIYGALRLVSVERGYNPADFALVAIGGAGPMCANAVGKLLGAWPVIIPAAPGILCAQGDATTKMSHELSTSFIHVLTTSTMDEIRAEFGMLRTKCETTMKDALDEKEPLLKVTYAAALRYKGQALELGITLSEEELAQPMEIFEQTAKDKFDAIHQQQFSYTLENFALELTRLTVTVVDASPEIEIPHVAKADTETPPSSAILEKKAIVVQGKEHLATFWDRAAITKQGHKVQGPAVVVEMDSNTLVAPGFEAVVDAVGNLCISPMPGNELPTFKSNFENTVSNRTAEERIREARKTVQDIPVIPTLISSSLASIRAEMDTLMLRCSMSPAIREQQDEFNVITNAQGKMLVGQFGSFIGQFLEIWAHKMSKKEVDDIEEGDVFITNDVYEVEGAVSHLNDVIVLLPIYYEHKLVGWAANFGHMTDVQGQVPGSMSINAQTIFDDGLQIPTMKLFERGKMNKSIVELMCRNSRQPEWLRSDLLALISACRTAATRVCELCTRFGPEVYAAATDVLLSRTRTAVAQIIEEHMTDEQSTFVDFVDDDGHGKGPFALKCTLSKPDKDRLKFDWHGTSPQASSSINYYLSETMFKMFVGYYLLAVYAPYTIPNDGFHDLVDVDIPLGSLLKPVRPAALSCRTHFLGRTMDIMQALFGQKNAAFMTAAGFSDSPHFFYSGFKPNGEWYQLYQIAFGGVPARPKGDGPDCHCLFPAIKSVPTESIELNFPVRLEVNEAVADSGGAGFHRGGNAQLTKYHFLSAGEFSLHDDRWFTSPWGVRGGKPGSRSKKAIHRVNGSTELLPSKCDHVKVRPGDVLEWQTWGGGGLGDPLTRPAETVALEVRRKLVTVQGAKHNYGVIINPKSLILDVGQTEALRADVERAEAGKEAPLHDRGGTLAEIASRCKAETGFEAPVPQWEEEEVYGPHVALPYVQQWYKRGREVGYQMWGV
ncbi:Putative hydantoinase A/oxoprolinase, hydantoinase B/oxoprolinase, hydantoinase/oxoprolinase [Septoria linicola]|uniref:Hydantoinase A/oxoprolinase, hydantoinase B/oxoprolinase, hydantoinase/oxoprolinase n=1 Tax=Septoria linicola TaxID=215465 RepID=A0A9Q9EKG7_9PEZI|nr:putative hydantoinase A/oxoprolinase, hydantoinase B/oxoprolinase, hydantoinase/oxoprolinase [Septoria linicola]USW53267.1 Putative hydantoinase A/oxoprolinase, hydantoinase B/oxoprolinase, hydantoinase/oxoprolinase [Septoria linicola]